MPQTDYSLFQGRGVEGGLVTGSPSDELRGTYGEITNSSSSAYIPFGRAIKKNSSDSSQVELIDTDGDTIEGITVAVDVYEKDADGNAGIPPQRPVTYAPLGSGIVIFMIAEEAVTPSDSPFVRFLANGSPGSFDAIGRVRTDADNGGATERADALTGAEFVNSAAAGEVVAVRL